MDKFAFKDLKVWQMSVEFADKVLEITENKLPANKHFRIIEQLESASISVSSNIAEGKGRWSQKEFVHFLYIARGSLFETVSLLTIITRRNLLSQNEFNDIEEFASEINRSLNALINSIKIQ